MPELKLQCYKKNNVKYPTEIISNTHVYYMFYSSGTVNVNTACSNNPHKIENEVDKNRLIASFGQIRDRLVILFCDKHERLVLEKFRMIKYLKRIEV